MRAETITYAEPFAVSQFTLLAKTSKGNKPDFHRAAPGDEARRLYDYFLQKVRAGYEAERVKDGKFQAMMEVALVNDGPVGIPLFYVYGRLLIMRTGHV